MKLRKKLIEVALPLDAINRESALRKRKAPSGYPTTLHRWWAQRPLAAARAVIFSQMVDDPSEYVDVLKMDDKLRRRAENEQRKRHKIWVEQTAVKEKADAAGIASPDPGPEPTVDDIIAEQERDRLFKIIEELVLWENTTNEIVLEKARAEIWQSWRRTCADNADHPRSKELFDRTRLPAFHDPFAGGGSLPLEAQRLGLEAYASDLNPVAVLINKAMIEIPPKFAGMPPVNPEWQSKSDAEKSLRIWNGTEGLAEDVRYYGRRMRDETEKRIGHLYPEVLVTDAMTEGRPDLKQYIGKKLRVVAWIWARTVKSPNPAFRNVDVPLASTFMLSTKAGKEVYIEPKVNDGNYYFEIKTGKPKDITIKNGTKLGRGANFRCLISDSPISGDYIKAEGKAGRMGQRVMAVVVEGNRGRLHLSPSKLGLDVGHLTKTCQGPEQPLEGKAGDQLPLYGMSRFGELFTVRQLCLINEFLDTLEIVCGQINLDFHAGRSRTQEADTSYGEAIRVYLAMAISRLVDYGSTLATWRPKDNAMRSTFGKQALQMTWDFAEGSPFASSSSGFYECVEVVAKAISMLPGHGRGHAKQETAQAMDGLDKPMVISTDPPYYDNICYADLSDFFYVWLRRSLRNSNVGLFSTLAVPKTEELIASSYRHQSAGDAENYFLSGMTDAMKNIASRSQPTFPVTIYYAFKQSEEEADGNASTGWDTFLDAVIKSGLAITGTWPVRTEGDNRQVGVGANALASSIVLVCRRRDEDAATVKRREFLNTLKSELPAALRHLQRGNIAPVDLAQAAIGPGMAVFTRYENVLDAEGNRLSVREALTLINKTLDEVLAEQEGDFDADTRWALAWFEEFGFETGEYGRAETLSTAKNTSISEMADPKTSPILEAKGGKVRLFRPAELEEDWSPETDGRLTVWDMVHQLIRVLEKDGETAAAAIVKQLGAKAETARELCYRLYTICERKKRANDALSYNALVQSWPEIVRLAAAQAAGGGTQAEMFDQ